MSPMHESGLLALPLRRLLKAVVAHLVPVLEDAAHFHAGHVEGHFTNLVAAVLGFEQIGRGTDERNNGSVGVNGSAFDGGHINVPTVKISVPVLILAGVL